MIESRAMETNQVASLPSDCSTREVARVLGMAVRSVQLMVDRGELEAWKTPGGHRRIARASVERWLNQRHGHAAVPSAAISANEVAVAAFLAEHIRFLDIAEIVEHTLNHVQNGSAQELSFILHADEQARQVATARVIDIGKA